MTGSVSNRQPRLRILFRTLPQPDSEIEFVVDTGFSGFLTLPAATVSALRLPQVRSLTANLADDRNVMVAVHVATILWDGAERDVEVLAPGQRPLLGTSLLDGNQVNMQFVENGPVTIEELSASGGR